MKVSEETKDLIQKIADEAIKYSYSGDIQQDRLEELLDIWDNLDRKEKIYLMKGIYELIHYRSLYADKKEIHLRQNIFRNWIILSALTSTFFTLLCLFGFFLYMASEDQLASKLINMLQSFFRHIGW